MRILKTISRIVIGTVFIFSGVVKAIDPLGSAYKFGDYFQAFNLGFLQFLALPLAIFLFTAEFLAGFAVLTGYRAKSGIWAVLILMLVFTPLTFFLALANPVSDCGCFGDAIHLTNWQTFLKNMVLIIPAIFLFLKRNEINHLFSPFTEWAIISGMGLAVIIFALLNLRFLPVTDFLPYKPGTYIPDKMIIPEGKPVDQYETTFIYEKEGQRREFTLDNYPHDDTAWVFVDQISRLVKKGYEPPINNISIMSVNHEDLTDRILYNEGYTLLMISRILGEAGEKKLSAGFELGHHCLSNDISFYVLTASGSAELMSYNDNLMFCMVDDITLKTMVRSNPGYILLRNGTITGKWSWATLPDKEWFTGDLEGKRIDSLNNRNESLTVIIIVLALTIVILSLRIMPVKNSKEKD